MSTLKERLESKTKTYILKYADQIEFLTDAELLHFIETACIRNRDIKRFEIIEIPR